MANDYIERMLLSNHYKPFGVAVLECCRFNNLHVFILLLVSLLVQWPCTQLILFNTTLFLVYMDR